MRKTKEERLAIQQRGVERCRELGLSYLVFTKCRLANLDLSMEQVFDLCLERREKLRLELEEFLLED